MDELKRLKNLKQLNYSNAYSELKEIMKPIIENLFDKNERNLFRVNYSTGLGTLADLWWIGVFDLNFYEYYYEIKDKRKISAGLGFYIVYLFNEENTKLFLSINQAAQGISKSISKTKTIERQNQFLRDSIELNDNYITNMQGELSRNDLSKARDYEVGNIIAFSYDLSNNIELDKFKEDFKKMLTNFEHLKEIIINNSIRGISEKNNLIDDLLEDENYLKTLGSLSEINTSISEEEVNELNNRNVDFREDKRKRVKVSSKLLSYVLELNQYKCNVDERHLTFTSKKRKKNYVEPHHLIPLKYQYLFPNDFCLDRTENIVTLCPVCHAAVHYGDKKEQKSRLKKLYEKSPMRKILKERFMISNFNEFYDIFYS